VNVAKWLEAPDCPAWPLTAVYAVGAGGRGRAVDASEHCRLAASLE
jgi:hypothetical protein